LTRPTTCFLRDEPPEEATAWLETALGSAPADPIAIYLEANCRFTRAITGQQNVRVIARIILTMPCAFTLRDQARETAKF